MWVLCIGCSSRMLVEKQLLKFSEFLLFCQAVISVDVQDSGDNSLK